MESNHMMCFHHFDFNVLAPTMAYRPVRVQTRKYKDLVFHLTLLHLEVSFMMPPSYEASPSYDTFSSYDRFPPYGKLGRTSKKNTLYNQRSEEAPPHKLLTVLTLLTLLTLLRLERWSNLFGDKMMRVCFPLAM